MIVNEKCAIDIDEKSWPRQFSVAKGRSNVHAPRRQQTLANVKNFSRADPIQKHAKPGTREFTSGCITKCFQLSRRLHTLRKELCSDQQCGDLCALISTP